MEPDLSKALLRHVAKRLWLASFGTTLYRSLLAASGLFVLVLLLSRFSGIIPDWFSPQTLLIIPPTAFVLALLLHRRPDPAAAARAVDQWAGTKDLYLTLALLDDAPGDFGALVVRDAESKSGDIKPRHVVAFLWQRRAFRIAALGVLLFLGVLHLPQLDPFGKVEAARAAETQQQRLANSKKQTLMRTAELKRDQSEGELSKDVKRAVEELKVAFNSMKPRKHQENLRILSQKQGFFGDKWQKLTAQNLKDLLSESGINQRFGASDQDQLEKWSRELAKGNAEALKEELSAMQKALEEYRKTTDTLRKAALKADIEKRLRTLAEFAEDRANAASLAAALKQAMRELDLAKLDQLSSEACDACRLSLDLAGLELEQLAQSARDLEALEQALKALQMAKKVNADGKLDGELCENCIDLADYVELYAQLMGDKAGQGDGLGNQGRGRGDIAPEDDSIETEFRTEQSKSAVTAGKVLLSTKTKGLGEKGDAQLEYRDLIRAVKQGVSEAILQEQIPPGYHEGIKGYFNSIETDSDPVAGEQE